MVPVQRGAEGAIGFITALERKRLGSGLVTCCAHHLASVSSEATDDLAV